MAKEQFLVRHEAWENWAVILIGIMTALIPRLASDAPLSSLAYFTSDKVALNTSILALVLLVLGIWEFTHLQRWEEIGVLLCGLWLVASPYTFGFSNQGALANWHYGVGIAAAIVASLELWQDWDRTDEQMAQGSTR